MGPQERRTRSGCGQYARKLHGKWCYHYITSQLVLLCEGDSRARRHVSGARKGFRPPKYNVKGNDGSER